MSDLLDLFDIDTDPERDNTVSLVLEARYRDGSTSRYTYDIESWDEIGEVTGAIVTDEMEQRIAQLSDDDRDTYDEDYNPDRSDLFGSDSHECTCHGACFCGDVPEELREEILNEAFSWLVHNTLPGSIVTWRWHPFGATGSYFVGEPSIEFALSEIVIETNDAGEATESVRPAELLS